MVYNADVDNRIITLASTDQRFFTEELAAGRGVSIPDLPSGAQAFLACALAGALPRTWVWVVDGARTLEILHEDVRAFADELEVAYFPALEETRGHELTGERLNALARLLSPDKKPCLVLTCIQALFQNTPAPANLAGSLVQLKVGQKFEMAGLAAKLEGSGYEFVPEVHARGEAVVRGGIIDVWPANSTWPVRLEFFADVLESIRTFDPDEQVSLEKISGVQIPPAGESGEAFKGEKAGLIEYLPKDAGFVWVEPRRLEEHANVYRATLGLAAAGAFSYDGLRERIKALFSGGILEIAGIGTAVASEAMKSIRLIDNLPNPPGSQALPDLVEKNRHRFVQELIEQARAGAQVHMFFDTAGSRERFKQLFKAELASQLIGVHESRLSEGFVYADRRLIIVAEGDLYGYRKERRLARKPAGRKGIKGGRRAPLLTTAELQPGDLVVHANHGIGKYLGLYEIEFQGKLQETLAVEYANKARLYVPVGQSHMLSRYVGIGGPTPELHVLGGTRWSRQKKDAERSVEDLAGALLETQAMREALSGYAFKPDTTWQHEFEAAFPYEETDDQLRAIEEVKKDMESQRPMDRLICGDAGYGKTEVAVRAAFKAVMDQRQVAVLVPTTVLAQQHYDTFSERMAAFPVTIEMLSRFRTPAEQQAAIDGLSTGKVDIVIGTHRLVQQDVTFKDLGLVIIDEEQRFGVAHKEKLKQLRQLVDVLTLTATPIPRTLYLSLTGARDMSTIQTPPQDRQPIETVVTEFDEELVRRAILYELNREGQVFYLHNRVGTIYGVEEDIQKLVPEARIAVAHGQMSERTLEQVMRRFIAGDIDVLLCTTIVESGLDIPNMNTIIIDRADRFGLAELYQLRGRVGRGHHQAYAYLLLPRHGRLFDTARKRLGAIKRYGQMGAGFKVALRDLEIRGAGNLLGAQQSGHIAAVGFDLYCQLLRRSVAQKKGESVPPLINVELLLDFVDFSPHAESEERLAAIPYDYIEDENHRLQIYRKLAAAVSEAELKALAGEVRDRFGPMSVGVERLFALARLRTIATFWQIEQIETQEGRVLMKRGGEYITSNGRFPRLRAEGTSEQIEEIIELITGKRSI